MPRSSRRRSGSSFSQPCSCVLSTWKTPALYQYGTYCTSSGGRHGSESGATAGSQGASVDRRRHGARIPLYVRGTWPACAHRCMRILALTATSGLRDDGSMYGPITPDIPCSAICHSGEIPSVLDFDRRGERLAQLTLARLSPHQSTTRAWCGGGDGVESLIL